MRSTISVPTLSITLRAQPRRRRGSLTLAAGVAARVAAGVAAGVAARLAARVAARVAASLAGRVATLAALILASLIAAGTASAASTFYIRGGGDGHGIGMSQYGAYGYALHGKDYRFILGHYYQGTAIGTTDPNRIVRVLLSTGAASFAGATSASDGKKADAKQLKAGTTYTVSRNADATLTLTDQAGKKVGNFGAPLTATGPAPLFTNGGSRYRGALEFRADGAGGIETVNALGLDDYVRGVISAEMPAGWSAEALKVQAVAARTYAITSDVGGGTFELYPDTRSQMYRGVAAEMPQTDAAVAATRGQVVTYKGLPVVTYFFNSSGGHTENIENVWPGATPEPWLKGVPDPYDNAGGDPYHRWGYDLTMAQAQAKLGAYVKGSLVGIQVTKHGASPRILTAEVVGTKGRVSATGIQLQHAFGLLTTYAAFTTITTNATTGAPGAAPRAFAAAAGPPLGASGAPAPLGASARAGAPYGASAVAALVPFARELTGAIPSLSGSVFPAHKGDTVAIQVKDGKGWRTVLHVGLASGGSFRTRVPGPGTYRVTYNGLDGPAVTAS